VVAAIHHMIEGIFILEAKLPGHDGKSNQSGNTVKSENRHLFGFRNAPGH
jgi:hypothetical protein